MKIAYIKVAVLASAAAAFFLPSLQPLESEGDNLFTVYLNGMQIGMMGDVAEADACLIEARKTLAAGSDEMVLAESELSWEGQEVLWGTVDDMDVLLAKWLPCCRLPSKNMTAAIIITRIS